MVVWIWKDCNLSKPVPLFYKYYWFFRLFPYEFLWVLLFVHKVSSCTLPSLSSLLIIDFWYQKTGDWVYSILEGHIPNQTSSIPKGTLCILWFWSLSLLFFPNFSIFSDVISFWIMFFFFVLHWSMKIRLHHVSTIFLVISIIGFYTQI